MEDDFILGAEEDIKIAAYVRACLPQEVKPRFSDDDIFYFMDLLSEYFTESGILDDDDSDKEIEINIDEIAEALAAKARKEKYGNFEADDIAWVIQAELDYSEGV